MEVPSNWTSSKRQRQSKVKNENARKKVRWNYETEAPLTVDDLCNEICKNVLDARKSEICEVLNFETILSQVPYKTILESLYGSSSLPPPQICVFTKKYEESFIRECMLPNERKCVMGQECECNFIDREHPFTGVEFLVTGQTVKNCTPQMCVLCSRKYTQKLFYDILFKFHNGVSGCIQRYGVINNVEGEYHQDFVLIMPPHGPVNAMPFPSVVHNRNNYKVVVKSAIRFVIQRAEMGFQMPPL
jgi:hypothetical protein